MGKIIDHTGKRYGKLTVIKMIDKSLWTDNHAKWECLCDCGKITTPTSNRLSMGRVTSCGCNTKYEEGIGCRNRLYSNYKYGATKRGYSFDIPIEIFTTLTSSNCFYCGQEPSQIIKTPTNNGIYKYNGLDRINNSLGYSIGNCIPCCKQCNLSKKDYSQSEFFDMIKKIYELHSHSF